MHDFNITLGMDRLSLNHSLILCHGKRMCLRFQGIQNFVLRGIKTRTLMGNFFPLSMSYVERLMVWILCFSWRSVSGWS